MGGHGRGVQGGANGGGGQEGLGGGARGGSVGGVQVKRIGVVGGRDPVGAIGGVGGGGGKHPLPPLAFPLTTPSP